MRIAIDGHLIQERLNGIGRYTFSLVRALANTVLAEDDICIFHEPSQTKGMYLLEELANHASERVTLRSTTGLSGATGHLTIANALREIEADIYHSPYRLASFLTNVPTVITIHELSMLYVAEETQGSWISKISQFTKQAQLAIFTRADAIICVSEWLRRQLLSIIDMAPDKVHVVHDGVDHSRFHPRYRREARQRAARILGIEPPYILALARSQPRKNLRTLLQAYARLPKDSPRLVLAGAGSWGLGPIYEMVREAAIEHRVRFTGYVPEAILPDLYAGAGCFVFPSLYEGFGLPVLEAMACGAPVVASNRTSIPEVAGNGALLVDTTNIAVLAEAINRIINNKPFRDELRAKAVGQAANFSWERTAAKTRLVYESLLTNGD